MAGDDEAQVAPTTVTAELLASGQRILDDAKATLVDVDWATNTAVIPILRPDAGDDGSAAGA